MEDGRLRWSSWHNHTGDGWRFSYCAEHDLCPEAYRRALQTGPWEAFAITEHAFSLALPDDAPWPHQWYYSPQRLWEDRAFREDKTARYLERMAHICDGERLFCGLETEIDCDGALNMDAALWPYFDVVIGSLHYLPEVNAARRVEGFFAELDALLAHPIDILGHPFRQLTPFGPVPDEVIDETLRRAHALGVAVEINAHIPFDRDADVLRRAAALGVTVAFGLDAHTIRELEQHSYFARVVAESGVALEALTLFHPVRRMAKPPVPVA